MSVIGDVRCAFDGNRASGLAKPATRGEPSIRAATRFVKLSAKAAPQTIGITFTSSDGNRADDTNPWRSDRLKSTLPGMLLCRDDRKIGITAHLRTLTVATVLLTLGARPGRAQVADTAVIMKSVREGVYSTAQAERGAGVFQETCELCHQPGQFTSPGYFSAWTGKTAFTVFEAIRSTMPYDNPGGLSRREYADVLTYIFGLNGLPAGDTDLGSDQRTLRQIRIEAPTAPVAAQSGATDGDWRYWGGDAASTRYSNLDQINAENVQDLEIAWRWSAANFGPRPEYYYRATPIEVDGVLYTVAGERRAVAAIDATTGETLWVWRMYNNPRWENSPRRFSGRGLAFGEVDGEGRIYVVTPGYFLVAIDAATGLQVAEFGDHGVVDLRLGLGFEVDPVYGINPRRGVITSSSPAIVVNGVVVVGNAHDRGYYPKYKENVPGHIRGYDARTGEQLWIFHVIPQPGEFGHETWEGDSWTYTGNISSWPPLSADPELGYVYIPTDCPTNDYYGGHRHGDNLYGTSVIALDVKTGERVWHQQLVKHDIWNYDNPTAPNLVDIIVDGRPIRALVQTTKQGWAYVFDRATGEPVWPMEMREVPESDVPGEKAARTQRFPTRPEPFELQGITINDLIDFTPELRAEAVEIASQYRMGPIFAPPSLLDAPDGTDGTLVVPGANGGTNVQGGAAVDPETGILYVSSVKGHSRIALEHDPERSQMNYVSLGVSGIQGPRGLPLLKPPYGRIVAIDLNTGQHVWNIPNGDTPADIKNHPALEGVDIPRTGKSTHASILLTKTLLFAGEGPRRGEPVFRAHDKMTGEILAEVELPATTNAPPMTYMAGGRQYIVVAVAGPDHPAELVALALPE